MVETDEPGLDQLVEAFPVLPQEKAVGREAYLGEPQTAKVKDHRRERGELYVPPGLTR